MTTTAVSASHRQTTLDPVTGLHDQTFLCRVVDRLIEKSIAQGTATPPITLALLQLENFYEIRRWTGAGEANLLLADIATQLQQLMSDSCLICRCQHHEFALLLKGESSLKAEAVARKIRLASQNAVSSSIPPQLELQCNVGLATVSDNLNSKSAGTTAEILFARARHQIGLSHYRGEVVEATAQQSVLTKSELLTALKRGLSHDQLQFNFQGLVATNGILVNFHEVRLEMNLTSSKVTGKIPAILLVETAVQNALGEALDRQAILTVKNLLNCATLGSNRDAPSEPAKFVVTLTQNSLVSTRFFDWLDQQLIDCPQLAQALLIQISEIDVLIAQHHMQYFSKQLKQRGLLLCISNFGCTNYDYSKDPFRYLSLLKTYAIKLDNKLLDNISHDGVRRRQLQNLVAGAEQLALRIIVGQVEDMALVASLWRLRIFLIQGYCFQLPQNTPRPITFFETNLETD